MIIFVIAKVRKNIETNNKMRKNVAILAHFVKIIRQLAVLYFSIPTSSTSKMSIE
jgi:hypothetical protein